MALWVMAFMSINGSPRLSATRRGGQDRGRVSTSREPSVVECFGVISFLYLSLDGNGPVPGAGKLRLTIEFISIGGTFGEGPHVQTGSKVGVECRARGRVWREGRRLSRRCGRTVLSDSRPGADAR